jgi:hypothetical protein
VQTEQWQLIVNDVGAAELYDLRADSAQANNLASDNRFADVLARLQRRLAAEVRDLTSRARR